MSPKARYYHIYCDESSHINKAYIVLGGILVDRGDLEQLNEEFLLFRRRWNANAEMKWTKISTAKLPVYKGLIDFFCDRRPQMRFKAIVLNGTGLRRILEQVQTHPAALDALQSELIVRMFGNHLRSGDQCTVFVDNRQSPSSLYWVRDRCNAEFRIARDFLENTVREVRSVDSKSSWQIQLADVLMGAIASELNRQGEPQVGSPAKLELVRYLKQRMRIDSFHESKERSRSAFTILHWDKIGK